ncbi:MAG: peptidoglycan DD-metalloendopeptidase family protein, partial [Oscillospiraceae bacterium]|nr:peptidoglycan DD-metalloendopeptidase family protein [Oscillospiraceae bacterium]
MSKIYKKFLSVALAAALVLSLVPAAVPVEADAASQEELDELKSERDALASQRQQQQAVVNELRQQQASVLVIKQALDERNAYTQWQIQLTEQEIELYDGMIADKELEVEEAKRLENQQLAKYRSRVRAMEENGSYNVIAYLFNSSNLGELLTAVDDIGEIMESDRQLEDDYIEARENTEAVVAEYEEYKADIVEKQDELRAEQDELEKELDEAVQLITDITANLEENAEILAEFQAAEQQAETNVANMVIALEKQRAAEQAASGGGGGGTVVGTGSFTWPVPSCTYLTSRFGLRIHPVYGTQKSHTGIDIGAASGATIVAAEGGTVTMAGVNGGYGNCVMIDHGNGYKTLYGHMSSIAVTNGQTVSAGDTVGYVGSTG